MPLLFSRWLYSLTYEKGTISMIQRRKYDMIVNITEYEKQKGGDLTQSYDKHPCIHPQKNPKSIVTT